MGLFEAVETFCNGFQFGKEHLNFRAFLEADREAACEQIACIIQQETPEQLEQFEEWFLSHSISVVGQGYRLRAMELYAYLKLQETFVYKTFRGFRGAAGKLDG